MKTIENLCTVLLKRGQPLSSENRSTKIGGLGTHREPVGGGETGEEFLRQNGFGNVSA